MKTPLQNKAELVAAGVIGCDYQTLAAATEGYQSGGDVAPIMGIDIIAIMALVEMIMTMVMDLLEQCPQQDHAEIVVALKHPNLWQRVRFNSQVRAECRASSHWRGRRHARKIAREMMDAAEDTPDSELAVVVKQCCDHCATE